MSKLNRNRIKKLVDNLISYAKRSDLQLNECFYNYIRILFSQSFYGDFSDRCDDELLGLAYSNWQILEKKDPAEVSIRVFNSTLEDDGWESPHTLVIISCLDMPFLVDSIRLALTQVGVHISLTIHVGGMKVVRNEALEVIEVGFHQEGRSDIEAPIYLEIDKQLDDNACEALANKIEETIDDVRSAVKDWCSMEERLKASMDDLASFASVLKPQDYKESVAFIDWLLEDHFIFLGARDYQVVVKNGEKYLKLVSGSGLGVLADEAGSCQLRAFSALSERAQHAMLSNEHVLVISKTNTLSTVHRFGHTDYVAIKLFDHVGELVGERRFIGLYTSSAYNSDPTIVPFLRKKIASIMKRADLPPKSHAQKDLAHILITLPRDDLIQGTVQQLFRLSMGILYLQERRTIRLFVREDSFGRFFSCLIYLPKEKFNSDLLERMQAILMESFQGIESTFSTQFPASVLARIHYIIRVNPFQREKYDVALIEEKLTAVSRSWGERLHSSMSHYFESSTIQSLFDEYSPAFPLGYQERFNSKNAVYDIEQFELLDTETKLGMRMYRLHQDISSSFKFKLFHLNTIISLATAFPILKNMGLTVIGEHSYYIVTAKGRRFWVNDFEMTWKVGRELEIQSVRERFQDAFYHIWLGEVENDTFNCLVLEADFTWRQVQLFQTYSKYLKQVGFTNSQFYIAETLIENPEVTKLLYRLFDFNFNPHVKKTSHDIKQVELDLLSALDLVRVLDQDRILRKIMSLINATLRTNYFQKTHQSYVAIKIDPSLISDIPLPLPRYEIFVYSAAFEGVHLRMGKIARGGLRWSDRREDYRTEVLGLMKAQQVKNAVIVPDGAKGGFVIKRSLAGLTRDAFIDLGKRYYQQFISALLDLTDNIVDEVVVHPEQVVCKDGDDTYLVVAADKGTATFSDLANDIALKRHFWLGDAFASGGSEGFDHKVMGITARGAWVSVERHFQDLGVNVDEEQIAVIGIGDMAGDVFGNGMLISSKIKLVAAFNHKHIFLDPNPNPELSFHERKRLFSLPHSLWTDYDTSLISKGGGVFDRSMKSIELSDDIRDVLDIKQHSIVPSELVQLILKAPVDLLWNGGIGTFVKSVEETHESVGDPQNDALRINGCDLRVRVVAEGGNLGLTQLGRIEYAKNEGRINSDFIDNSAGVDCSDHEVNVKILLRDIMIDQGLSMAQRNRLLVRMTDEVGELVLQNNYHQNEVLSLACFYSKKMAAFFMDYLASLEKNGKINRALEFLPTKKQLLERISRGKGFVRPEYAVLLEYCKIILSAELVASEISQDTFVAQLVQYAFPSFLRKKYLSVMHKHPLRKNIIATQISNRIVSDMGIAFVYQMQQEMNASSMDIAKAYLLSAEVFGLKELTLEIEALDYTVDAGIQYELNLNVIRLIRQAVRWLLRNKSFDVGLSSLSDLFRSPVRSLFKRIPKLLSNELRHQFDVVFDQLVSYGIDAGVAEKMASVSPMYHALNIVEVTAQAQSSLSHVTRIYFTLIDRLHIQWLREKINELPFDNRWSLLAKSALKVDLDAVQRGVTLSVLQNSSVKQSPKACIRLWETHLASTVQEWLDFHSEIHGIAELDYATLSIAVKKIATLNDNPVIA